MVGPQTQGFTPNVNVINEDFPGKTPEEYISLTGTGRGGVKVDQADVIELGGGRRAARFFISQTQDSLKVRSLGIAVTGQGTSVLATLTTTEDDFDQLAKSFEPQLRTLRLIE